MATLDPPRPPNTPHAQALNSIPMPISNPIPSSSPAFATPVHPIRPYAGPQKTIPLTRVPERPASVLPILLPPATLRPIAFRTLTKKHNLTLTSSALQVLANFIGRHCGASWREDGLAELVLEEVARSWKRAEAKVIVDTEGDALRDMLKQLEVGMSGGRVVVGAINKHGRGGSRGQGGSEGSSNGAGPMQRQDSFGMSRLEVEEDEEENEVNERDPRAWLRVVDAFSQPRLLYNPSKKHFEKAKSSPTFFPPPAAKTALFRNRYHLIHQRILRHASFQTPAVHNSATTAQWRITPIANLLGRSGSGHLLLGLLTITPAGTLAISDLTGSIHLDLSQAAPLDTVDTYLCPGMIVLVDGVYEEEFNSAGGSLGNMGGVGGTIGGRFIGFSIGAPRCETRASTLGLNPEEIDGLNATTTANHAAADMTTNTSIAGSFGWTDFLGLGSEKAVGARMRKIEQRVLRSTASDERVNSDKVVVIGHCTLDNPRTLAALRAIFSSYTGRGSADGTSARSVGRRPAAAAAAAAAAVANPTADNDPFAKPATTLAAQPVKPPLAFVLLGPFTTHPAMSLAASTLAPSSGSTSTSSAAGSAPIPDSITTKESFDALAALLADFPKLLTHTTWVFVPSDGDAWTSAFSAGAAAPIPRQPVPEMLTSRIRRVFNAANAAEAADTGSGSGGRTVKGEAIWTSNPSRLTLFGTSCEMVLFRDDVSGRLRRSHIPLKPRDDDTASKVGGESPERHAGADARESMDVDVDEGTAPSPEAQAEATGAQASTGTTASTTGPQRLTKTLLDQSHLSPFPLQTRPQHWDYASSALSLYPLPNALVLCDGEMETFAVGYQGVAVLNAGRVVGRGRGDGGEDEAGREARWCEYNVRERKGVVREGVGEAR